MISRKPTLIVRCTPTHPNNKSTRDELAETEVGIPGDQNFTANSFHSLASVAGTKEPEYGPSAIQPVTNQSPAYSITTKDDFKWKNQGGTNVETATFYFMTEEGVTAMAQIIYSSVA